MIVVNLLSFNDNYVDDDDVGGDDYDKGAMCWGW